MGANLILREQLEVGHVARLLGPPQDASALPSNAGSRDDAGAVRCCLSISSSSILSQLSSIRSISAFARGSLIELVRQILLFLKDLFFKEGLRDSLRWLLSGSPLVLRLTTLGFLIVSVILSGIVFSDISETNRVMFQALSSPVESMPHPNSAIEALLLASVLPKRGQSDSAGRQTQGTKPKATTEFSDDLRSLQTALVPTDKPGDKPELMNAETGKLPELSDAILSDRHEGFLFVPGAILPALTDYDVDKVLDDKNNVSVAEDIAASQVAAPIVCGTMRERYKGYDNSPTIFTKGADSDAITPRYVQSYLIFRSGVTRLCETSVETGWKEQRAYYANKFTPRTLLQTRFYFEPSVQDKQLFSTGPYIDLGGNGVVETFCHYVPVGEKNQNGATVQRTDAVLCFDFSLAINLRAEIQSEVSRFGGTATDFVCKDNSCMRDPTQPVAPWPFAARAMSFFFPPSQLDTSDETEISDRFAAAKNHADEAVFFGDVTTLDGGVNPGIVKFTVPMGGTQILAIKIDVNGYQNWRIISLASTAACIAVTMILALLILADYGLKFREQERAFAAVDSIMSDVPSPYARLDEDGKFLKVNDAFAQLLGYRSAAEGTAELRRYKYEEFLYDDVSKEEFRAIKLERREGKPYRSYTVQFWTGGRPGVPPVRWLKVHGGDVPAPHTARKKPGQSFGILIPVEAPKPIAVIDQRSIVSGTEVSKTA
jgi:PAS domain-containing protein